tara:strand:- start:406 stop:522 length:117 start_codon:yes stop_codon:yes gene_type:complete
MIKWLKRLLSRKPKKRARDEKGRFVKDDPKTRKNEAYE